MAKISIKEEEIILFKRWLQHNNLTIVFICCPDERCNLAIEFLKHYNNMKRASAFSNWIEKGVNI